MPKIGVIVAARMESKRFPQKMMADICGQPMIARVLSRVKKSEYPAILAVPGIEASRHLIYEANRLHIQHFSGDPDDVLDRYFSCSDFFNLDIIVRITGDCPLIDPAIVNMMVEDFLKSGCDYCYNTNDGTIRASNFYPDGMDVEVFSFAALENAYHNAKGQEREHVTQYILHRPEEFKIMRVAWPEELPEFHWSVDRPEDLAFVRLMYSKYPDGNFNIYNCIEEAKKLR